MKLKETEADILVKSKLFNSTISEVMTFAKKHASAHVVGQVGENNQQKDTLSAAKKRGYTMTLVRRMSRFIRRDKVGSDDYDEYLARYRVKLKL